MEVLHKTHIIHKPLTMEDKGEREEERGKDPSLPYKIDNPYHEHFPLPRIREKAPNLTMESPSSHSCYTRTFSPLFLFSHQFHVLSFSIPLFSI